MENKSRFAKVAYEVFWRFGARKARMEEIAHQAGVSKPVLYAEFGGKDAALAGAMRYERGRVAQALERGFARGRGLDGVLEGFFLEAVLARYDRSVGAPEPMVFDEGIGPLSTRAAEETRRGEQVLLANAMARARGFALQGTSPSAYAGFLARAALQARLGEGNRAELLGALEELKRSALAVAGQPLVAARARAMAGAK